MTNLEEDSKRVLRVILRRPVISGGELVFLAGMTTEELKKALEPLLSERVVSTNTPGTVANESYFNLNPSARRMAEYQAS